MSKNINTLGVLGLGSRSTLFYLDALNKLYNIEENGYSTCPLVLYNTNFNEINPYLPNHFKNLLPRLSTYLQQIESFPISHLLLPNITIHEAIDKLKTSLKIIHPLKLSIAFLKEHNTKQIVVFGSKYTMTSTYLSSSFSSEGIQVLTPLKKNIEFIDDLRQKIYSNTETLADITIYNTLVTNYSKKALVLVACTELSIIPHSTHVLDMAQLQIEEAIKRIKQH